MEIGSKINPILTISYMTTVHENKYFDRKSAKIKVADLAPLISAFANADGGTIVIGISDKSREIEGINVFGDEKINGFINAPRDCCRPMPDFIYEFLDVINVDGQADRLLLLHIKSSSERLIRTAKDETWLRLGDKTKVMLGDNLRNLEYAKGTRRFEDEINMDAELSDLDGELLCKYMEIIDAEDISIEQLLRARGFLKRHNGKEYLTNAAVLLFAKNIQQFYPNCRIRFLRYDGNFAKVGTDINIVRDKSIDKPILSILQETQSFIASQLREFTALNLETGRFQVVPEYPEFAWLEGIVNAVAHRDYSQQGAYIKVTMYDDRLEILSPGKLPNVVTVGNIKETRYSRNPRISRVMTEFGWVRELNEGVKRIFADMKRFFLDEPLYSEPEQAVLLVLKNNIVMRRARSKDRAIEYIGKDKWTEIDDLERTMLAFMVSRGNVKSNELASFTGKAIGTVTNRLRHLIELGVVKANGNKYDPKRTYEVI